ncbi:MAG: conjugal transfer protein TraX [Clostridia bacterium]|nr:conjugal transfer protein TraX [Clostridia bacterium]
MSGTVVKRGLTANTLRILAMIGMLLDHAWATVVPGNFWMTCVGRLVFPIYAFQLVEGFFHSRDRKAYAKRLLIFALVSEIPFNLMMSGSWFFPFHQNTIFTLLLGYLAIWLLETREGRKGWKTALLLTGILLLSMVGFVDYGWQGLLTVVTFYVFREGKYAKVGQLACMFYLHAFLMEGQTLPWLFDLPLQSFAVLALIPIWLYNGQKGRGGKAMQWAGYLYYPLHMVALVVLRRLI